MAKALYDGKVQVDRALINRFKSLHPHYGDFARVMRELLTSYIEAKEAKKGV